MQPKRAPVGFDPRTAGPALIFVTATWCGHCQRLKPTIAEVTSILGPAVPVYQIDADADESLIKKKFPQVEGFPTIFLADGAGGLLTFGSGERSSERILSFVCNNVRGSYAFCPTR